MDEYKADFNQKFAKSCSIFNDGIMKMAGIVQYCQKNSSVILCIMRC